MACPPSDGTVAANILYKALPMPPEVVGVITFAAKLVINVTRLLKPSRPGPNVYAMSCHHAFLETKTAPYPDPDLTAAVLPGPALPPIVVAQVAASRAPRGPTDRTGFDGGG